MPLSAQQAEIITIFMEALDDSYLHRLFFVQGEGGAGKSFMMNAFIKWAKERGLKLAICSTTGIASTVLEDGRTVHSTFFAPWKVDESTPVPDWLITFFRELSVVVIDEATMMHRNLLHYVDRCLCKAMGDSDVPFGGKMVITMGDWQQVLPVVKSASPHAGYMYCMKNSPLWPRFHTLRLDSNLRIRGDDSGGFRELLRKVGRLHPDIHECIAKNYYVATLPKHLFVTTEEALIDFTFPLDVLAQPVGKWKQMVRSAILCPRRATVARVNGLISARLPGDLTLYDAHYDPEKPPESRKRSLEDDAELEALYARIQPGENMASSTEFREWWNTSMRKEREQDEEEAEECEAEEGDENGSPLDKSRYPPAELGIKLGTILLVLETIDKARGPSFEGRLFNGIRLQVVEMRDHALRCRILNLPGHIGSTVWIYRRRYLLKRETRRHPAYYMLQFPVQLAFALTINKGQAQTLERVGVHLGDGQVFTHGQLYSAMSRGQGENCVRLLSSMGVGRVRNVVLQEALAD